MSSARYLFARSCSELKWPKAGHVAGGWWSNLIVSFFCIPDPLKAIVRDNNDGRVELYLEASLSTRACGTSVGVSPYYDLPVSRLI